MMYRDNPPGQQPTRISHQERYLLEDEAACVMKNAKKWHRLNTER